jgi:hypothetical protein
MTAIWLAFISGIFAGFIFACIIGLDRGWGDE